MCGHSALALILRFHVSMAVQSQHCWHHVANTSYKDVYAATRDHVM